jgi:hypothetical protein
MSSHASRLSRQVTAKKLDQPLEFFVALCRMGEEGVSSGDQLFNRSSSSPPLFSTVPTTSVRPCLASSVHDSLLRALTPETSPAGDPAGPGRWMRRRNR